ncbi:MAG: diguanylate cyclase [Methylococcaceae bacterium]|nr:diguanylate cyclase [Methylococcaceae bacterium]
MLGITTSLPLLLIVDDDPNSIHLLADIFNQDYDILFAKTGKKALEIASQEKPSLILLDVMMPDLDGYEVCKQLKQNPDTLDIPIIFVTAHSNVTEEIHALEIGASDFISKPFSPAIVKLRVKNQIELRYLQKQLMQLTITDGLTGISNRRSFDQKLFDEWHRAIRMQQSLTVIMIDVDHFKKYNDCYGHQAGDACLKNVVDLLMDSCNRNNDFVARYGGEEFAMILPETTNPSVVMEKLFQILKELAIPHEMSEFGQITLSAGISIRTPNHDENPSVLICEADKALYTAKNLGRNQAVLYEINPANTAE